MQVHQHASVELREHHPEERWESYPATPIQHQTTHIMHMLEAGFPYEETCKYWAASTCRLSHGRKSMRKSVACWLPGTCR